MDKKETLCIGGVNVDWTATSPKNDFPIRQTPFTFIPSVGGVMYNVAQNLYDLGHGVHLISAIGDDDHGEMIRQFLQQKKISHHHLFTIQQQSTASIIFIVAPNGELILHIARTEIYDIFGSRYFEPLLDEMSRFQTWVVDTDLSEETLSFLGTHAPKTSKLFGVISTPLKAKRIMPMLPFLEGIFLNKTEASHLLGTEIETDAQVLDATDYLKLKGIPYVFMTLGGNGVCANTPDYKGIVPALHARVQDTQGAGDAFAAAVIDGLSMNNTDSVRSIHDIICRGLAAASIVVEVQKTSGIVSPQLIEERIQKII